MKTNNFLKKMLAIVLVFAMLAPTMGNLRTNVSKVHAEDTATEVASENIVYEKVSKNDVTDNLTVKESSAQYSKCRDYLFAGWYKDEAAKTAAASKDDATCARFVPAELLNVKCQVTNGVVTHTSIHSYKNKYILRFVSSIDSLDYKNVGFEISYVEDGITVTRTNTANKVFKRIESTTGLTSNGIDMYEFSPKVISTKSEYFVTAKWPVAEGDKAVDYTVRAFWTTKDGTKVYGADRCVSVEDGLKETGETRINLSLKNKLDDEATYTATYKNALDTEKTCSNVEVLATGTDVRLTVTDKNLKSVTEIAIKDSTGNTIETVLYRNLYTEYAGTADTTWYDKYSSGNEFVIASSADLYGFAAVVSGGETFSKKTVYVVADINVNPGDASTWSTTAPDGINPWTSIGFTSIGEKNYANFHAFAGTFDGGMHTISGIYHVTNLRYSGFFAGTAESATVKNLKLKNSYFKSTFNGYGYFGSIVGDGKGTFDTIYCHATVETTASAVGGIVGGFRGTGNMNNCWFAGTLTNSGASSQGHGGLVGFGYNATLTMTNCLNSGTISSNSTMNSMLLGGLIGGTQKEGGTSKLTMNKCLNVGLIQPTSDKPGFGSIIGGYMGGTTMECTKDSTYATAESCKDYVYPDFHTRVNEADVIGDAARTTMGDTFDWENTWVTVTGKTPKLKSFENESYGRVNTRWYDVHEEGTPYILYDAEDLYGLAAVVNSGEIFEGETILLGADIVVNEGNANNWDTFAPSLSWTPIGNGSKYFKGTFDGQGHTISGLYMDTTARYAGLFGWVSTVGTVRNLKLTNSYFKSTHRELGAMAGAGYGSFYNIYCNAIVEGTNIAVGGFIGQGGGDPEQFIKNCWFAGSVTRTSNDVSLRDTGGFIGQMQGGKVTMENCLNTGTVDVRMYNKPESEKDTIVYPKAGGFIGTVASNARVIIQKCVNVGEIKVSDQLSEAEIKGYGPFIGWSNNGPANITITDSYASDSCPVTIENVLAHNNIPATYTIVSESNMKGSLAQDNMPNLEWNDNWKVVEGDYPEVIFMYATIEDQVLLSSLYEGRALYQGDIHDHAYTYGRGQEGKIDFFPDPGDDGEVTLSEWLTQMDTFGLDFAASLDHNQIDHYDLLDHSKFVYGSEAEAMIYEDDGKTFIGELHFDMLFKSKNVFQKFIDEHSKNFIFESSNIFSYDGFNFTKSEFIRFIRDIINAGGVFNIPHPLQNDNYSSDLEDLYFEVIDETNGSKKQLIYGFQAIWGSIASPQTKVNHPKWVELLSKGYRIYATSGSDTHKKRHDEALTSIYANTCKVDGTKCTGNCGNVDCAGNDKGNLLTQVRVGDYTAGAVGIQMCMYGDNKSTVMGGSCDFSENKRLVINIGDIHYSYKGDELSSFNVLPTHKYQVEVYNEKGLVYTQSITPGQQNYIALDVEDCGFYRVEVYDLAHKGTSYPNGLLIGLSNPIWNDEYTW